MANEKSLLKYSLKTNIIKSIYFEIVSKVSKYYYAFGKSTPWPTVTAIDSNNQTYIVSSEEDPPAVSDSYPYELETRNNILYMKSIDSNDAAIVVPRINWAPGFTYDMYDDYSLDRVSYNGAQSLDTALFYVLTSDFNVYKCLFNNNNQASAVQPTGNSTEPIETTDGYVWKFMYSIPLSLRNKFLTTSHMPVVTALSNQFYSNGSINSYNIENKGSKYIKNSWSVKRFVILNGGVDYQISDILIDFPLPELEGATIAVAEVSSIGDNGNILEITMMSHGSGYLTQPIPTISNTVGTGLEYLIEYEKDGQAYTELKISGDGYNEFNPFNLKKINVLTKGVFTSVPSGSLFTFPSPDLQYGYMPEVQVTFGEIQGSDPVAYEVTDVAVTNQGYGYSFPLVFGENVFAGPLVSDNSGFTCDLDEASQKNEAELIPLINDSGEISSIQITNPGIGYTYATVEVISKKSIDGVMTDLSSENTPGFIKASILLNFDIGDIETKQSNVELLAVDGSIQVIKIENGGNGYPSNTTLTVNGDGTGCQADVTIKNGKISKITVTNPGHGYTNASIQINGGGSDAVLRPIISPQGGHGKDSISELYARTIALVGRLSQEKNQGVVTSNDYRQICILKNPKEYGNDSYYRNAIGSTCAMLICDATTENSTTYNLLEVNDELKYGSENIKSFTLVEKNIIDDKYYLLVQINDNFVPLSGSSIYKTIDANSYPISISSISLPDINKFSGELLYIDNRIKFASSEEQAITTSTLISF